MHSLEEKYDIYNIYIRCHSNSSRVAALYLQEHLNRQKPYLTTFIRIVATLASTGSIQALRMGEPSLENLKDVAVLMVIIYKPKSSSRKVGMECGVSWGYHQIKTNRTLHEEELQRGLHFCHWLVQNLAVDENYIS